jgi:hypothetical protein
VNTSESRHVLFFSTRRRLSTGEQVAHDIFFSTRRRPSTGEQVAHDIKAQFTTSTALVELAKFIYGGAIKFNLSDFGILAERVAFANQTKAIASKVLTVGIVSAGTYHPDEFTSRLLGTGDDLFYLAVQKHFMAVELQSKRLLHNSEQGTAAAKKTKGIKRKKEEALSNVSDMLDMLGNIDANGALRLQGLRCEGLQQRLLATEIELKESISTDKHLSGEPVLMHHELQQRKSKSAEMERELALEKIAHELSVDELKTGWVELEQVKFDQVVEVEQAKAVQEVDLKQAKSDQEAELKQAKTDQEAELAQALLDQEEAVRENHRKYEDENLAKARKYYADMMKVDKRTMVKLEKQEEEITERHKIEVEKLAATHARELEADGDKMSQLLDCVVCMNAPKNVCLIPCPHVCLCEECADGWSAPCPICRADVTMQPKVFLS